MVRIVTYIRTSGLLRCDRENLADLISVGTAPVSIAKQRELPRMPPRVGVVTIGDACEKRLVTERVELATVENCVICDCTSAIRTSEIILSQSVIYSEEGE